MSTMTRRALLKNGGAALGISVLGIPLLGAGTLKEKFKIVVTGGHPDDPETGCGGLIALLTAAGHDVSLGYLTRGEAGIPGKSHDEAATIRTKEAEKACDILGCTPFFLGQIDGDAKTDTTEYQKMHDFLVAQKPDLLLTHWCVDTHRDHRACSALTYDAWLRLEHKPDLYFYEVLSGSQTQNFAPTDYVDITEVKNTKRDACLAHKSQKLEIYYEQIHGKMEEFRGMESGFTYAEAYIRHAWNPKRITDF